MFICIRERVLTYIEIYMDYRSLPTLLHRGTPRIWYPLLRRWMTVNEKLAHMGLPSAPELAEALQIPVIKGQELEQGHGLVVNGMHMPNIGMIIFSVLACVELRECDAILQEKSLDTVEAG